MARWQTRRTAGYADMPRRLQDVDADSPEKLKRERADWLEKHGLTLVDFLSWKQSRDPLARLGPPSRRKLMSAEQLAALDARLERGPPPW